MSQQKIAPTTSNLNSMNCNSFYRNNQSNNIFVSIHFDYVNRYIFLNKKKTFILWLQIEKIKYFNLQSNKNYQKQSNYKNRISISMQYCKNQLTKTAKWRMNRRQNKKKQQKQNIWRYNLISYTVQNEEEQQKKIMCFISFDFIPLVMLIK